LGEGDAVAEALRRHGAEVSAFGMDAAQEVAASHPERIAVAGGDGSIAPAAAIAATAGVPLAVVPVGTANDFARRTGLPEGTAEAARVAAIGSRTQALDLARMGSRPFVNVASIGLAPVAAGKARRLKRALGAGAYLLGAVRAGLTARPVACRVACDGAEVFAGRVWQATVACTGAFGGGAELPADPRDGLLDVVVMEAGSRAALLRRAQGMRRGTVGAQPGVRTSRGSTVDLDLAGPTPFNVDGEVIESGSVRFEVEREAFELVIG
jgi:diacylglycerol kinase (ATP)